MGASLPDDLAAVLADSRLSYAARGIYANCYLRRELDVAAPLDAGHIGTLTDQDGRRRVTSAIHELQAHGYYVRRRVSSGDAKFAWHFELTTPDEATRAEDERYRRVAE